MSTETIEEWAARVATTLDRDGWADAERDARHPDGGYFTNDQRWHGCQARALLAFRAKADQGRLDTTQQPIRANYISLNADGTTTTVMDGRAIYRSPAKEADHG